MQMNLLSPDVQAERLARNRGAERAADHADRVQPGWSEQAYEPVPVRGHSPETLHDRGCPPSGRPGRLCPAT